MHSLMSSAFCTLPSAIRNSGMSLDTSHDRLKHARKAAGYKTAAAGAAALGVNRTTYTHQENGRRGYTRRAVEYARKFRVTTDFLLHGIGGRGDTVPVTHMVGEGAVLMPATKSIHATDESLEIVQAPQGVEGCIAARICGSAMHPMQDGWLLFYSDGQGDGVSADCLGKLCVVNLPGNVSYVKILRKGSVAGKYHLESWNYPLIENVSVVWATRVLDIRPS